MNILTIIPAKMDSKRLIGKNLIDLNGKPMLKYSIDYATNTIHNNTIVVSSESDAVKEYVKSIDNVIYHNRSIELCGDVEVVDVYTDVVRYYSNNGYTFDLVIGLQPDNPDRSNSLDECIDYMINNNYDDLITVNSIYKRSGSVRIFKWEYIVNNLISKRIGCILDTTIDIHTNEDLEFVKNKRKDNG